MHIGPDWVMVIITGIYVVATIIITIANIATVREMRREFNLQILLNNCPHLLIQQIEETDYLHYQGELTIGDVSDEENLKYVEGVFLFSIHNIGNVSAENVYYIWDDEEKSDGWILNLAPNFSRQASLRVICSPIEIEENRIIKGMNIYFSDPINNKYVQYVSFFMKVKCEMLVFERCVMHPVRVVSFSGKHTLVGKHSRPRHFNPLCKIIRYLHIKHSATRK